MIPKLIHFFWADRTAQNMPPPPEVMNNIRSWQNTHPELTQRIWTERDLPEIQSKLQGLDVIKTVNLCRFEAMKSDVIRLAIVTAFGGIYSDLKNESLSPFPQNYLGQACAIVTKHPPTIPREDYYTIICNAFLACPVGHDLFKGCLEEVISNVANRKPGGVSETTGIYVVMRRVLRYLSDKKRNDLIIIESDDAWGVRGGHGGLMRRTSASYNGADASMHWSVRQKSESAYNES